MGVGQRRHQHQPVQRRDVRGRVDRRLHRARGRRPLPRSREAQQTGARPTGPSAPSPRPSRARSSPSCVGTPKNHAIDVGLPVHARPATAPTSPSSTSPPTLWPVKLYWKIMGSARGQDQRPQHADDPRADQGRGRGVSGASDVRTVAFYLPQFHPIPENDEWWGPGFTDWVSVATAPSLFRGHHQPHLPADLGYYDLRVPEVQDPQAELAVPLRHRCVLLLPLLVRRTASCSSDRSARCSSDREPDFPFLLCWANEPGRARGTGRRTPSCSPQTYSADDDVAHLQWLAEASRRPRYLRIDGKPVFLMYRTVQPPRSRGHHRPVAGEASGVGIGDLYLCSMQTGPGERHPPSTLGFDAAVQFAPFYWLSILGRATGTIRAAARGVGRRTLGRRTRLDALPHRRLRGDRRAAPGGRTGRLHALPCITPGFDNSPRRAGRGVTILARFHAREVRALAARSVERFRPPSARRTSSSSTRGTSGRRATTSSPTDDGDAVTSRPAGPAGPSPAGPGRLARCRLRAREPPRSPPVRDTAEAPARARALAFYLPQFHPIPENDEWWGPGFTEWTNVAKARPLFPGHDQPHAARRPRLLRPAPPGDPRGAGRPGRGPTASRRFCYWHYWFAGRRLLERPFHEVLRSGEPDFPFCLGWANQNWSTIWTGGNRVLIEQTYPGPEDRRRHFEAVLPAFARPALRARRRSAALLRLPPERPARRRCVRRPLARAGRGGRSPRPVPRRARRRADGRAAAEGFDAELQVPLYAAARRRINGPVGARLQRLRRRPTGCPTSRWPASEPAVAAASAPAGRAAELGQHPPLRARGFVLTGATPEAFGQPHARRSRRGARPPGRRSGSCS